MSLVSCSHAQQQKTKEFRLPDVPVTLTAPEDRAAYLSLHYWDHFDFADTSLISRPEITEQAFVDFLGILPYTDRAQAAIDTLFRRAATGQEMLYHFIGLSDKYLYEPNSPMHDEELHILVLRALLDNPCLSDTDKIRPRYLLEIAMKNRPGRRVKELLTLSPVVNDLLESGRLKLLSVCVEGKTPAWEKAEFPAGWIDGYDADQRLTREQVYDLKAMPTLYLLDAEKRVILKDASFEQVEERLS